MFQDFDKLVLIAATFECNTHKVDGAHLNRTDFDKTAANRRTELLLLAKVIKHTAVMRNHAIRKRKIRFVFVLHVEAIDIIIVRIIFFDRCNLEIFVIVDNLIHTTEVALISLTIPTNTMKRIMTFIFFAANNNRFVCSVAYINDTIHAKRRNKRFNLRNKFFRSCIDSVAIATIGCIIPIKNTASKIIAL